MNQGEKTVGRGTLYILVCKIAITLIALGQVILVPKILGPESMGFYFYWFSIFSILAAVFGLGGYSILARYIPELRIKDEKSISPLIRRVLAIKLPVILIALLIGLCLFPSKRYYYIIILVGSVFFNINSVIEGIFYAYKQMHKYILVPLSRILIRLSLILFLFPIMGNWGILLAILNGSILTTLILGHLGFKLLPESSGRLIKPFGEYMRFGLWIYLATLFATLTTWLVVVLASKYVNDMAAIGYLGLGLQICLFAAFLFYSVGESALPTLVEFHVTEDQRFKKLMELNWRYTNLLLFPIIFGIFILIKPIIIFLVGREFIPSVELIYLFLPASILLAWSHIHYQILFTFEKKTEIFLIEFIKFIIFFLTGLYLIKVKGILGAPIALSLGALAGYIHVSVISLKIEKISGYVLSIIKPLLASIGMSIILSLIQFTNVIHLFGSILLGGVTYLGIMWLIKGFDKADILRIKHAFGVVR